MHRHYADILALAAAPPLWFDEHAVPRFAPFTPDIIADISADEAVLLMIACQNCRIEFHVALSSSYIKRIVRKAFEGNHVPMLAAQITAKTLHYGDPPNMGCCPAGPTMNCIDLRVLEYWRKNTTTNRWKWERDLSLETEIESLDDY